MLMEKELFNIEFGKFIRLKREALGLTQQDLSAKMNIDYQSISRLERGKVSPTLYWCYGLAEVLEIELPSLLNDFKVKF